MVKVTVKTLSGTDHQFELADELTVQQFKEKINETVQVPADRQRLIFQGRVLRDDQVLGEIGVHERTIHLVERLPGFPASASAGSSPSTRRRDGTRTFMGRIGSRRNRMDDGGMVGGITRQQMVMGAVALQSGDLTRDQITACLRRVLDRIGEIGRRAELETREIPDGSVQVDIRIRSHPSGGGSTQDGAGLRRIDGPATQRIVHIRHVLRHVNHILYHLENDSDEGADGQPQPAEPENASAPSNDPFSTCCHQSPTQENAAGSGATTDDSSSTDLPSENNDHVIERDSINGEETEVRQTRVTAMASMLDEILRVEERMRPILARYQDILRQDADYAGTNETESRRASRLFNSVQTIFHNLGHVYHAYSDLNIHFCQAPPRNLYPQLVGQRAPPSGQGSLQRTTTTLQTAAEVQITMNFQRGGDQDRQSESAQPSPPSGLAGPVPPVPSISVQDSGPQSAGYTSVDISPNSVTINQVTARIETDSDESQNDSASRPPLVSTGVDQPQQRQQQQQQQPGQPAQGPSGLPPNFLQQLMQGITGGAAAGMVSGNFTLGPNFAAQMQRMMAPQQQGNPGRGPSPTGGQFPAPSPQQGQMPFMASGLSSSGAPGGFRQFRGPMLQPQNLVFTAAPYNSASNVSQPAVFVGNEPPAVLPLYTFDEFLPCGSRHFDPRQRPSVFSGPPRRPNQQTESTSTAATSTGTADAETMTENANGPNQSELDFERVLEPVVRSVVNVLQETVVRAQPGANGGAGGREALWQFIPIFTGATIAPHSGPVGPMEPTGQANRLRLSTTGGPMRRPSSDPNLIQRGQQGGASDRQMLEGMVRGVYSGMMGNSTQSLADYLRSMGQESERSDSQLVEMLQTVMLSLSFSDIWALFANDARPLDRSRSVLRRYFVENLLNGNESPSEEDLKSAASRASLLDAPIWTELTAGTDSVADSNFAATMLKIEEAFMLDVLRLVFGYNFTPGTDFGRQLYDRAWLYARETVTAASVCCAGGEAGFDQFANRVVMSTMRQINEDFRQPFAAAGVQHLRTLYTQHRLDRAAVEQYLVKNGGQASAMDTTTTDDKPKVENESSVEETRVSTAASVPNTPSINENRSSEDDWQRQLPPDWVRVIEVDVERQRTLPQQAPFSDAYLNGMPSKRRKVIYDQRPRAMMNTAATSTGAFLQQVLREAITDADVSPITGEQVEDVVENVSVDANGPELTNAFARNVEQRFTTRLRAELMPQNDTEQTEGKDFDPTRFPNATDRFLKK